MSARRALVVVAVLVIGACESQRVTVGGDAPTPNPSTESSADGSTPSPVPPVPAPDQGALDGPPVGPGRCEVCTDPIDCCTPESMICVGKPDEGVVCSCDGLWDCDQGASACRQPLPGGPGDCRIAGSTVTCSLIGAADTPPIESDNPQWSCSHEAASQRWRCLREHVNPCGAAVFASQWSCEISTTPGPSRLHCDRL